MRYLSRLIVAVLLLEYASGCLYAEEPPEPSLAARCARASCIIIAKASPWTRKYPYNIDGILGWNIIVFRHVKTLKGSPQLTKELIIDKRIVGTTTTWTITEGLFVITNKGLPYNSDGTSPADDQQYIIFLDHQIGQSDYKSPSVAPLYYSPFRPQFHSKALEQKIEEIMKNVATTSDTTT